MIFQEYFWFLIGVALMCISLLMMGSGQLPLGIGLLFVGALMVVIVVVRDRL